MSHVLFDSATRPLAHNFAASILGNTPAPDPLDDYQRAYQIGRFFGLQGREPFPPADWPALFVDAFHAGREEAADEIDHDKNETHLNELARLEDFVAEMDVVCSGHSWL